MWTRPLLVGSGVVAAFRDGRVVAYDRATGAVVWQRKFPGPFNGLNLVLEGARIIVPEYEVHAISAETGALLWSFGGITGTAGVNTPAVSDGVVFTADAGSGVAVALDAATGGVVWSVDIGEALFTPTLTDELVLYGTRSYLGGPRVGPYGAGHLIALDRVTGDERWRFAFQDLPNLAGSGGLTNAGLVVGDRVILGGRDGRTYAIRIADGELVWEQPGGNPINGGWYSHAGMLLNGLVTLVRGDGIVEARDVDDGSLVWSTRISSTDTEAPVKCGNHLCTALGRIWVLDGSGNILWAHGGGSTGTTYSSAPAVDTEGRIFIGARRAGTQARFRAVQPPVTVGATQ
jgi:outer membrane protein assembly factor BamB